MTNNKTILVVGGTGMLGKPVAQQLKVDGFNVRLLARNPEKAQKLLGDGFEIIKGDVDDPAALRSALTGVDGVHISLKGGPTEADFDHMDHIATRDIAQAAKELGVGRVTILSAYAVSEEKADTPESRSKLKGEAALKSSGVPYTIFRASWFMETLPMFVQGKSISLIGNQIHPLHWIAAEDYARMVSKSYQTDETLNKELYIFGPEAFTMGEAMKIYAEYAGVKVAPISIQMLAVLGALTFNTEWKGMAVLMKHYENWGEDGSPDEANHLLGAPATTLKEWCNKRYSQPVNS
ncbi:NAD(P)H-binding protein [Candidatus Villigracilis saccharophilus]|uniref:SDR family oxidoreductase n=1 Tax=Candidatus Villigracilis saccharophilus TaxID=3140684 RepID=UPI0031346BE6|nr:NAD(P)H-binding protein [Anaerolineales bacterium]